MVCIANIVAFAAAEFIATAATTNAINLSTLQSSLRSLSIPFIKFKI